MTGVRGRHVLIVEDDEVTAFVLQEWLGACGYRTSVASNGAEGIAKFNAERPDIALVDVLLPRKDGYDVCFAMKKSEHGRHTPVVLMSAIYRDKDKAEQLVKDAHADGFLLKPFDLDVVASRVEELVNKS